MIQLYSAVRTFECEVLRFNCRDCFGRLHGEAQMRAGVCKRCAQDEIEITFDPYGQPEGVAMKDNAQKKDAVYSALAAWQGDRPATLGDLAEAVCLTPSVVSSLLTQLRQDGFVARVLQTGADGATVTVWKVKGRLDGRKAHNPKTYAKKQAAGRRGAGDSAMGAKMPKDEDQLQARIEAVVEKAERRAEGRVAFSLENHGVLVAEVRCNGRKAG